MRRDINVETLHHLPGLPFQEINERSLLMYSQLTVKKDAVPDWTSGIEYNAV